MAIQSNYPSVKPSLLLDFANTKSLDPRITFTRASTANYYDGKTATLASQNLLAMQNFAAWNYVYGATITANAFTAPDGTTTAALIAGTTATQSNTPGNSGSKIYYNPTTYPTVSAASKTFTGSVYCYSSTGATVYIGVFAWGGEEFYSPVILPKNSWTRIAITSTFSSGSTGNVGITLVVGSDSVYVWGSQIEQRSSAGAYVSSANGTAATYIPTLQSAASGVARFDSNPTTGESLGLLIEESRTNILLASSQFETTPWTKAGCSISANTVVAPDGTLSGDTQFITSTAGFQGVYQSQTGNVSGTKYTLSVFAKTAGKTYLMVGCDNNATHVVWFNIVSGTVGTAASGFTGSITAVGDGWYRCSVTWDGAVGANYPYIGISDADNSGSATVSTFNGIYIWGAQLEAGSSATSYVATPLTFTSRASSATYLGPNGYITSASTNVARNQTNSVGTTNLLLEAASSNLLKYTEDFGNSYWDSAQGSIAVNQTQGPDGLALADAFYENTPATFHSVFNNTVTTTTGVVYTFSAYVKANGRNYVYLYTNIGPQYSVAFNLSTGTYSGYYTGGLVAPSYSITAVGGGWYRLSITSGAETGGTTRSFNIGLRDVGGDFAGGYAGDTSKGMYVWGAQVEAGSTATSYIPSTETFSGRTSSGTYYNSSGVLSTATSGTARTTYNPALLGAGGKLLLEPAATNLALYSEQFNNWVNAIGSVTTNTATAPDGNVTADTLTGVRFQTPSLASNTYSFSCYCKKVDGNGIVKMRFDTASSGAKGAFFDLNSGTVTSYDSGISASITPINNGWYRCAIVGTYGITNIVITSANDGTNSTYVWGGQLETGSGPTSYILTTTATVTRAADTSTSATGSRSADVYSASTVTRAADAASMTGTNFSSWYRTDTGTFYSEGIRPAGNNLAAFWSMDAGYIDMVAGSTNVNFRYGSGGSPDLIFSGSFTTTKAAGSYQPNANHSLSVNGGTTVTSTTVSTVPAATLLRIGYGSNGTTFYLNGPIKKIAYYPQLLTNAQLQALTT